MILESKLHCIVVGSIIGNEGKLKTKKNQKKNIKQSGRKMMTLMVQMKGPLSATRYIVVPDRQINILAHSVSVFNAIYICHIVTGESKLESRTNNRRHERGSV